MLYPKLVESKTAANDFRTIVWNPGMDLLASVFSNGTLTCSRLLSLQKVWHKQPPGKIISIAWRPDGRVLAIAAYFEKTKENVCTLHDVEDGKEIHSITTCNEITSIAWFNSPHDNEDEMDKELILSRVKKSGIHQDSSEIENFSHQLAHKQTQLNILLISTEDGVMNFYALGLFHLGEISASLNSNSKIVQTHMSRCMKYVTSNIITQNANSTLSTLRILKLDIFHRRSKEMLRVAKMYARITDELEHLDDTLSAITTSWTDVLAGLDHKLSSYCSRKIKKSDESRSSYTFISADDLLQLLVLGTSSDNLEKFLADMSDKGLRKLNSAIEQTCLRVQNLIVKNAEKCCYHLHNDLNMLRGMSLWTERFSEVGLEDKTIVDAIRDVGSLLLKLTELQQVIDHSLKSTKSFFRWLISIACRLSGEQNNTSVPNDINKTTQQDIQLITDFILENFDYNYNQNDLTSTFSLRDNSASITATEGLDRPTCSNFTLEQVGQYFKNEPLSRLKYSFTKHDSNFWIEFIRLRSEFTEPRILDEDNSSVLLFYPHNSDTSLIQEHKRACKSIKAAFESVSSNIRLLPESTTNHINLKDFIRNGPAEKIRIETDQRNLDHLTLFQLKASPVPKQYLIIQSLEEKTFKLLSLEFQTILPNSSRQSSSRSSTSSTALLINDSCFYELRQRKKILLTFLLVDQAGGDTIIVQVDMDKIVDYPNCITRNPKDIAKIFRTNELIDKHSAQVVMRLDVNTQPACERKHEPEMMVKKIKGVSGKDIYASSSRGVIAFTSCGNKRVHLYELESSPADSDIMDEEEAKEVEELEEFVEIM